MKLSPLRVWKKNRESKAIFLDLGTAKVKVAVCSWQDDQPQILSTAEQEHGLSSFRGKEIFQLDAVLESCSLALERLSLSIPKLPETINLTADGISQTINYTIRLQRTEPDTAITEKELQKILHEVEEKTASKRKEKASVNLGIALEDIRQISSQILNFYLDDKQLNSPLDFTGKILKIVLQEEYASTKKLEELYDLGNSLGFKKIKYQSPHTALYAFLKRQEIQQATVINIGGKITEVISLGEKGVNGNRFFNWGGNHLTSIIGREFDLNFPQAEKLKMNPDKISQERQEKFEDCIRQWAEILFSGCISSLKKINPASSSSLILITGGGANFSHLTEHLSKLPWHEKFNFSSVAEIKNFHFSDQINFKEELKNKRQYENIYSLILNYQQDE